VNPKTGTGSDETLRPEARPLPYARLDQQQQAAVDRVVGLLTAAAQDAKDLADASRETRSAQEPPAGPYLDATRRSRNILLGGERGTGKTTLMLSLAKVLDGGRNAPGDDSLPEAVAAQVSKLNRRMVWLETLDMEPLSGEANLLGAVLARIEDSVGARFPSLDKVPETVPLLYPGHGYHDVSRELARLQTSVALTFDGNLSNRAGSLDPDTFAVESRRAERERLGLDRRFADVLAGLSAAVASAVTGLEAPVFVLPVDDVDLNVTACMPLLRLLRATSSPHLIVLLAADVTLLSTIMRLNYQKELAQVSSAGLLGDADQRIAADLAVNALRKHVPPAQRVVLGLVSPGRALALRPLETDDTTLSEMLGGIALPDDSAALQLDEAFGLPVDEAAGHLVTTSTGWPTGPLGDPETLTERLAPYSWPQVLRQPLRRLVDLYLDCAAQAGPQPRHDPLAHDTADTQLTQLARVRAEAIRASVSGRADGSDARVIAWTDDLPGVPPAGAFPVQRLAWHGWQTDVGYVPLDRADAAALVGCLDLLGLWPGDQRRNTSSALAQPKPVRATWWPPGEADRRGWIAWPWVTHSTFWGYERAMAWLDEADQAWGNGPDAVFGSWVAVMTAQLFHAPGPGQYFDRPTCQLASGWDTLAEYLAELEDTRLGPVWLDAVGLLCTREMGMTNPDVVASLLPPGRMGHIENLRRQRAAMLPPRLREQAGLAEPTEEAPTTTKKKSAGAPRPASARGGS
jgi:hypothetical protein